MLCLIRRALRDAGGAAAVEFVMIAPFLIFLVLAVMETGRYLRATERVESVAASLSQMLAEQPSNPQAVESGDAAVNSDYVHYLLSAAGAEFPDAVIQSAQQGQGCWWCNLNVSMGSVRFKASPTGCSSGCTYTPEVVWNWWGFPGCGSTFIPVSPSSTPQTNTLPSNLYGPNSLVVVNVDYVYTPIFLPSLIAQTHIIRAVYQTPRYVPLVEGLAQHVNDWAVDCGNGVLNGYY